MLSYLNPLPSLPQYRGPHKVGTAEYEIPISEISSLSNPPDENISTIKFRLYYPTRQNATSRSPVYWLPEPQNEWNDAYSSFMGASSRFSAVMSRMLGVWNYATLSAVKDATLASSKSSKGHPVCIFSHGLGGNFNTYSSILGNMASCGVFCIAPEHRDGSAPVSFVRDSSREIIRRIPYQKLAHSPTPDVLNARNEQLRVRLWEIELTYAAIKAMSEGKAFTNYADTDLSNLDLEGKLNLTPAQVTWAGHSFGGATMTQFVKSVFYHKHLPQTIQSPTTDDTQWDQRPLLQVATESELVKQITPDSPVALLDLWTMPLRGDTTKWLWERPMPSYYRQASLTDAKPSVVAVMSGEFYKWTELLNRTRAVLSRRPVAAIEALGKKGKGNETPSIRIDSTMSVHPIPELNKQKEQASAPDSTFLQSLSSSAESSRAQSPARSESARDSAASSQTSLVPSETETRDKAESAIEPHLYLVPQSAHLSQSDFGLLFPNLTKYFMKAVEPEKILELNLRAVLAVMRGVGLPVESVLEGDDHILECEPMGKKERWVRVPLVDSC